jgi:hypothetical protein
MSVSRREGETEGRAVARAILRPTVNSARTLRRVLKADAPSLALMDLADELTDQCTKVIGGDLTRPEALLLTQAQTLDLMFHDLARMAYDHLPEHSDTAERIFRLAFRAQGQSRATLEALGALKNPPVVIAEQANVTTGPQQVNNGIAHESGPNKLLEHGNGEWLDPCTTSGTGGGDPALEAVGAIDRAANGGR